MRLTLFAIRNLGRNKRRSAAMLGLIAWVIAFCLRSVSADVDTSCA